MYNGYHYYFQHISPFTPKTGLYAHSYFPLKSPVPNDEGVCLFPPDWLNVAFRDA